MVDLVDTFTKTFGRPPSEEQLGDLMRMKAEQERAEIRKFKSERYKIEAQQDQKRQMPARKKPEPDATPKALSIGPAFGDKFSVTVNRLLRYGLTADKIAYSLFVTEKEVQATITAYHLPRPNFHLKGKMP